MNSREKDQKKPIIHYTWVGTSNADICKILKMSEATVNPIIFYCPDSQVEAYRGKFNGSRVEVQGIETTLRNLVNSDKYSEDALEILRIYELLITNAHRNKIIDRVNFKEIFSLFIIYACGGYAMDTNIGPAHEAENISLPSANGFAYPTDSSGGCPEVWMMYSPANDDETIKCLKLYLNEWRKLQLILENKQYWNGEEEYPFIFHKQLSDLIIDTLTTFELDEETLREWMFYLDSENNRAIFKRYPIQKNYGNSHKHDELLAFDMLQRLEYRAEPGIKCVEKDDLIQVVREYKQKLVKMIKHGLGRLNTIGASDAYGSISELMDLLINDASYMDLINCLSDIKKEANIVPEKRYFIFSSENPENVEVYDMATRILNGFKHRTNVVIAADKYLDEYKHNASQINRKKS